MLFAGRYRPGRLHAALDHSVSVRSNRTHTHAYLTNRTEQIRCTNDNDFSTTVCNETHLS